MTESITATQSTRLRTFFRDELLISKGFRRFFPRVSHGVATKNCPVFYKTLTPDKEKSGVSILWIVIKFVRPQRTSIPRFLQFIPRGNRSRASGRSGCLSLCRDKFSLILRYFVLILPNSVIPIVSVLYYFISIGTDFQYFIHPPKRRYPYDPLTVPTDHCTAADDCLAGALDDPPAGAGGQQP